MALTRPVLLDLPRPANQLRQELALERDNTAQFFKRDMGTETKYVYQGIEWNPVLLSAEVLKKLKQDAEERLRCAIQHLSLIHI